MSRSSARHLQAVGAGGGQGALLGALQRGGDDGAHVVPARVQHLGHPGDHLLAAVGEAVPRRAPVEDAVGVVHLAVPHEVDRRSLHGHQCRKLLGRLRPSAGGRPRQASSPGASSMKSAMISPSWRSCSGLIRSTRRARTDSTCPGAAPSSRANPAAVSVQLTPRRSSGQLRALDEAGRLHAADRVRQARAGVHELVREHGHPQRPALRLGQAHEDLVLAEREPGLLLEVAVDVVQELGGPAQQLAPAVLLVLVEPAGGRRRRRRHDVLLLGP